jgi:hypothetical protein
VGAQPGPVPAYRGGQLSSACKLVLVGPANYAGPDGVGAFPSVATLVRYTGPSERTVRSCLDRLEATSIIRTWSFQDHDASPRMVNGRSM